MRVGFDRKGKWRVHGKPECLSRRERMPKGMGGGHGKEYGKAREMEKREFLKKNKYFI